MKICPNRDRNIAVIYIRESLVGKPTKEFGPLLLHELLHLVIDPIVEEHTFQLQYEVSEQRLKEYQKRFRRPLEKVVEHLTNQVAPLLRYDEEIKEISKAAHDNRVTLESQNDELYKLRQDNEMLRELIEQNSDTLNTICRLLKHSTKPNNQLIEDSKALRAEAKQIRLHSSEEAINEVQ